MTDVYAAVESIMEQDHLETTAVCDVLSVSRSAYYAWRSREPLVREARDFQLAPLVRDVSGKLKSRPAFIG